MVVTVARCFGKDGVWSVVLFADPRQEVASDSLAAGNSLW